MVDLRRESEAIYFDALVQYMQSVGYAIARYDEIIEYREIPDSFGGGTLVVKTRAAGRVGEVKLDREDFNNFYIRDYKPKQAVKGLQPVDDKDETRKKIFAYFQIHYALPPQVNSYRMVRSWTPSEDPLGGEFVKVLIEGRGYARAFDVPMEVWGKIVSDKGAQKPRVFGADSNIAGVIRDGQVTARFKLDENTPNPPRFALPADDGTANSPRNWEAVRESVIKQAAIVARGSKAPQISYNSDGTFKCNCAFSAKHPVCPHIAAMLLEGRDRRNYLNKFSPLEARHTVVIPIGMGRAFCKAYLRPLFDNDQNWSKEFAATSELDPDEPVIIGAAEGLLPYIKYTESLLRTTIYFAELDSPDDYMKAVTYLTRTCGNRQGHTQNTIAYNVAGLRPNRDRENFVLGTVATLEMRGRCIPCHQVLTGVNDVPDV